MDSNQKHLTNLLKGAGLNVLNFGVAIVVGFILAPYILKTLGEREYGINVIVAGLVGAFSLADLGISAAVSRFFTVAYAQKNKEECLALSNTAFFVFLFLGVAGFLGLIITACGIYYLNPAMEDRLLLVMIIIINGFTFCINFPMNIFIGIVNGTMRQELTGGQVVIFRIFGAFITFLILFSGGRLIALACANLVIALLNMIVLLKLVYIAFPEFFLNPSYFRKEILLKLIRYGTFTFLVFVSGEILNQGSVFIISTLINFEAVALFSMIAMGLSSYLINATEIVMGNWLTSWLTLLYSKQDKELADKTLKLAYKMSTCFTTFCAFGLIVWGQDFLMRWGGKNDEGIYYFLKAYPCLVLITIGVWIAQCQSPNTKYLYAIAKHSFIAYAGLIGNTLVLIEAASFLYLGYGVEYVAGCIGFSMFAVRGIAVPIYVCLLRKENIVIYFLRIFSYFGCAGIACIIPYLISYYLLAPNYLQLILVGFLCSVTYFPVYLLITINKTEWEKIWNIFRTKEKD
ncbi:MAG: oligosaccharide flippase family protein [Planctomycetaceae bacterium]|jgi:O-antigen/teichoic acid export membrane protein|nr:oligosaccharide flippase family protein [Planctomycetaceae bacterium]